MLKDIMNIQLHPNANYVSIQIMYCNLEWNSYVSIYFRTKHLKNMRISDAHKIWQRYLLSLVSGSSALILKW